MARTDSAPRFAVILLACLCVATPVASADDDAGGTPPRRGLRSLLEKAGDTLREEAMKRFDKDGDGKLDEAERKEAMEAMRRKGADLQGQVRQFLLRRFDADKDGTLDETERKAALDETMKQLEQNGPLVKNTVLAMVKKRYDADGDGTLGDEELEKAREDLTARLLQTAGGKPRPAVPAARDRDGDDAADPASR